MDDSEPDGAIPAVAPALDRRFRRLTERGHRALRGGAVEEAETLFRDAAAEADALFDRAGTEGAAAILIAPMAVTVAACNRASLRNTVGEPRQARAILEQATERLIAAAASAATPIALRLNCLRHLRHALHLLADLDHAQGGTGDGASPLAERVAAVATEVIRIAEILRGAGTGRPSEAARSRPEPAEREGRSAVRRAL